MILTCVEERRNGHTANQVFQEEALPRDENGYEGCQGIVERQIAHLRNEHREHLYNQHCEYETL